MKALFSLWTRPMAARPGGNGGFPTLEDFLRCCALSVNLAVRHYGEAELVTDSLGKAILHDALQLPFTRISTALDDIPDDVHPNHWALSKMVAYAIQKEPFVHIDFDVFLWNRLPARLESAAMFGQNAESRIWDTPVYRSIYRAMFRYLDWLPPCFGENEHTRGTEACAINAGVIGGQDVAFINDYATQALEMVLCSANREGWKQFHDMSVSRPGFPVGGLELIVEQYLFARAALWQGKWNEVQFLLDERQTFENPAQSALACREAGYTHLATVQSKHDKMNMAKLLRRVTSEFPNSAAHVAGFRKFCAEHPLLTQAFGNVAGQQAG